MLDENCSIPLRLCRGGRPHMYAAGGLARAANDVAGAGRYGDSIVIHVNKREFDQLRQAWGNPHINPDTGLPEFWNLGDLWDSVKKFVAPVVGGVAGAVVPGIGSTIGQYLPGRASALGTTGTQALGSGLLGAGVGALTTGWQGAGLGALGGVAGAYAPGVLNQLTGTTTSPATGAISKVEPNGAASISPSQSGSSSSSSGGLSGLLGGNSLPVIAGIASAIGNAMQGNPEADAAAKYEKQSRAQFNQPLPEYDNPRKRVDWGGSVPDYTKEGERSYYTNNSIAYGKKKKKRYAEGGLTAAVPDGRSDAIDAKVSPGEYVMDAETVSMLGNGSNDAGAQQLDRMRENLRRHKGSALAQGMMSPDALPPEAYMGH